MKWDAVFIQKLKKMLLTLLYTQKIELKEMLNVFET